jgi:phosphoglycerate kinase
MASSSIKTLDDLLAEGVSGRGVLVRSDLNVPLDDNRTITDPGRIIASVPTLKALSEAGAKVIVTAHLGRPKDGPAPEFSLAPVAKALSEQLDRHVQLAGDVVGSDALARAEGLTDGDILLLENIRFDPRETSKNDDERGELAGELAALTGTQGVFVSDGFGVVHRKQASVYDLARELPAYAGGLVLTEVEVLRRLTHDPERPYAVVLGGSKVSDKLQVIESLLPQVDSLLVGGGMCFTFLAAQGLGVGDSLLEEDQINSCRRLLESGKVVLPVDVVVADDFSAEANTRTVPVEKIPDGWKGLDIGPESVAAFAQVLASAKTVFWNGPMGVFELAPFAEGTRGVAQAIIDTTRGGGDGSPGFSVVGGGDSAAAVRALGLPEDGFSHISTGGGASLEYLEGKVLPGLDVLEENP